MKALTKEWIKKAEKDVGTSRREFAVKKDANWDAVCFHAKQALKLLDRALSLLKQKI